MECSPQTHMEVASASGRKAAPQPYFNQRRVIPPQIWNEVRQQAIELKLQKVSLVDIMALMETEHKLKATKTQWKKQFTKWGVRRNLNLADAAHILRLSREADRKGLRRKIKFNKYEKTRTDITRYIKKSDKVGNEEELLNTLPGDSALPDHITYEDIESTPNTPFVPPEVPYSHPMTTVRNSVSDVSGWLNVPPGAITPNRSGSFATPKSTLGHKSSFSSFEITPPDFLGLGAHASAEGSMDDLAEEDEDYGFQEHTGDLADLCLATTQSPAFGAAVDELVRPKTGRVVYDARTYGFMSTTPTAMVRQQPLPGPNQYMHANIMADPFKKTTPANVAESRAQKKPESANFLGYCFSVCVCRGQSYEDGADPSIGRMAEDALSNAMASFRRMCTNHDGETLSALALMFAMLEALGQIDMAKAILEEAQSVSELDLVPTHELPAAIRYLVSVASRNSDRSPGCSAENLKNIQLGVEAYFGSKSPSSLAFSYYVGWALLHEKNLDEAEEVLGALRYKCESVFGPCHIQTVMTGASLARLWFHRGRVHDAELLIAEMINRLEKVFAKWHPYRLEARSRQAIFLTKLGKLEEAEEIMKEVVKERCCVLGSANPRSRSSIKALEQLLHQEGKIDEANQLWRQITARCVSPDWDDKQGWIYQT